jgi:hypothetical protein
MFLAAAAPPVAPSPSTALVSPRMSFADAIKPFSDYRYNYNGYVGKDGKVRNDGLGCSGFTSAVLHRMRGGEDWLRRYDVRVHQWSGDRAAEHFALKKAGTFTSADLLDPERIAAEVKSGKVKADRLYYFNARKGKNGHVGFVRFGSDGSIRQWHYSSISKGLYKGEFRGWLGASLYRTGATVEFYAVPE